MSPFAIGVVAGLALLQASISAPRENYADCLNNASQQAAAQQVAPDQYSAFAVSHCAAMADKFRAALVAFDVKNGIKRARATEDAQMQLDDYLAVSVEKYQAKAPKPKPTATPAPVPAAAPAQLEKSN